jgi:hypothetical protein
MTPLLPHKNEDFITDLCVNATKYVYWKYFDQISKRILVNPKTLLIDIPCNVADFERRSMIRKYQIDPYKGKYAITFKFILGRPSSDYLTKLKSENETFRDLDILWNVEDSRGAGQSIKSLIYYNRFCNNMCITNM